MIPGLHAASKWNIRFVAWFEKKRFVFFIVVDGHFSLCEDEGVASGLLDFVSGVRPFGGGGRRGSGNGKRCWCIETYEEFHEGNTSGRMDGVIDSEFDVAQKQGPIGFSIVNKIAKGDFDDLVSAFGLTVGLWMIRSGDEKVRS